MSFAHLLPRLEASLATARHELLAARDPRGHWIGELSSSALATATAVGALAIVQQESHVAGPASGHRQSAIESGLHWLAHNVNADGGWGDTTQSLSNLSTTALGWAAFGAVPVTNEKYRDLITLAGQWLKRHAGGLQPARLAPAIMARYGKDRTFSAPILTMCALAGRLGKGAEAWRHVIPLPFELAACPHRWFAALRLPVVSYALPALIAIGQARHHHRPSRNPLARLARNLTRRKTLDVLTAIQPGSGGFLEATPLTSFVTMSLAGSGQADHPVTQKGVEFLLASARPDGSWPIDTNLATWLTTLAVNALAAGPGPLPASENFSAVDATAIRDWLLGQQYRVEHFYTHAAPGGWAWTDLPGGVPDADDTAGALLALRKLCAAANTQAPPHPPFGHPLPLRGGEGWGGGGVKETGERVRAAAIAGVTWLLDLQNRDGGIPTFCRGWGNLPFDRSSPDLTAHALRAWAAWRKDLPGGLQARVAQAMDKALFYLAYEQRKDGAWIPLWFGNQYAPHEENPTFGTARVLLALHDLAAGGFTNVTTLQVKGLKWLLDTQKLEGGWSGHPAGYTSTEETALALEALAATMASPRVTARIPEETLSDALTNAVNWLCDQIESGCWTGPSPIGFYFAKLWYSERLYPLIFTVGALERAAAVCRLAT